MTYNVELNKAAHKTLQDIPHAGIRKIRDKIEKFKKEPLPNGSEKLAGNDDLYRISSGDYRIISNLEKKTYYSSG